MFRLEEGRPSGNLLRNIVLFGRLLRALGIPVTPTQIVDFVHALDYIDLRCREDVKLAARAILVNRKEHLALFDQAFDLFWQARERNALQNLDLGRILRRVQRREIEILSVKPASNGEEQEPPENEEPILDRTLTYSAQEVLRYKDFSKLTPEEERALVALMQNLSWDLDQRRTRRRTPARRGAFFDLRRTIRQNMRHGAEPLHLARREPKFKRRPIVVICDISGSMERYTRVLLQFLYVITNRMEQVEAFVFSTRLTRITRQLRRRNIEEALAEAARVVHDWGGGTRIGEALKTFNYVWSRRVLGRGAVVLIISDGWDRGDVDLLAREMARLQRSCYRLIWLNPLLGSPNYRPLTRGMQAALPYIDDFLPVHNLASLEQLGDVLANLGNRRTVRAQQWRRAHA